MDWFSFSESPPRGGFPEEALVANPGGSAQICDPLTERPLFNLSTPWKINGWNIQITHEKKGKWSEPNPYEDMFQLLIFQGCI